MFHSNCKKLKTTNTSSTTHKAMNHNWVSWELHDYLSSVRQFVQTTAPHSRRKHLFYIPHLNVTSVLYISLKIYSFNTASSLRSCPIRFLSVLWACNKKRKKHKRPLHFRCPLPFHLHRLKALRNLPPLCVFSLIKPISIVERSMSFLWLLCPVRKWLVVNNYKMFICCHGYSMSCDCFEHWGYCFYQALDSQKDRNSQWSTVLFAHLTCIHSLWIRWLHTLNRDSLYVHVKLNYTPFFSFSCIRSARHSSLSKFIQPSGGCVATEMEKKSSSVVLCPQRGGLAIVLLDPCAAKNERGGAAGGRGVNGIYISVRRTCWWAQGGKKRVYLHPGMNSPTAAICFCFFCFTKWVFAMKTYNYC